MEQTNRAIIVSGALLLIFIVLVVIMLAWGSADNSIDRMYRVADYMVEHNNQQAKLIITFGGFIVALAALLIIIYEITPPETGSLRVDVGRGDARISTDEIAVRVEDEVRAMPQVENVQATVGGRGSKAEVKLALHVQPQADLAATASEAGSRTRDLIEGRMGIGLASDPKTELHYRELHLARADAPVAAASGVGVAPVPVAAEPPAWRPTSAPHAGESPQTSHEAEAAGESPPTGP